MGQRLTFWIYPFFFFCVLSQTTSTHTECLSFTFVIPMHDATEWQCMRDDRKSHLEVLIVWLDYQSTINTLTVCFNQFHWWMKEIFFELYESTRMQKLLENKISPKSSQFSSISSVCMCSDFHVCSDIHRSSGFWIVRYSLVVSTCTLLPITVKMWMHCVCVPEKTNININEMARKSNAHKAYTISYICGDGHHRQPFSISKPFIDMDIAHLWFLLTLDRQWSLTQSISRMSATYMQLIMRMKVDAFTNQQRCHKATCNTTIDSIHSRWKNLLRFHIMKMFVLERVEWSRTKKKMQRKFTSAEWLLDNFAQIKSIRRQFVNVYQT